VFPVLPQGPRRSPGAASGRGLARSTEKGAARARLFYAAPDICFIRPASPTISPLVLVIDDLRGPTPTASRSSPRVMRAPSNETSSAGAQRRCARGA
jgi:hypothetical protein